MKKIINIFLISHVFVALMGCAKAGKEIEDSEEESTTYEKHVLVMEFVSYDCIYCPKVSTALQVASEETFPGRIDLISVHGKLEQEDPMEFKGYKAFQNYFYGITGYPAVILDQRDDLVSVGSFDASNPDLDDRMETKAPLGIAVQSQFANENKLKVTVTVKNGSEANENYRLAVAILENELHFPQADVKDGASYWITDYTHQHVLREFLSENYFGDPIGSLGKNEEYSKSFTYTIPSIYQGENLSIVAYVIEATGFSGRAAVNSRSITAGKNIDLLGNITVNQ